MQLNYRAMAVGAALSFVFLAGCSQSEEKPKADVAQKMPTMTVDVQVVELMDLPIVTEVSGRTVAFETSEVRPQVSGIVEEILFQEGGMVQAGQPLYRINTESYSSKVAAQEATLNQAQANVGTAKATLLGRQAELEQAEVDLARLEGLLEIDAISRQAHDRAVTAVKTARAGLEQARANLASAESAVYLAQASVSASRLDLNRTIVRAPISGKVGISSVTKGALVSAGQTSALVTISSYHPIYVDISQSSADLLRLREALTSGVAGMGSAQLELQLEDGSIYPIKGQLMISNAKVDEGTGAVTLRAIVANPEGLLLPGMFVKAYIEQSVVSNAVRLPQAAIMRTPQGDAQVYVVDDNKKIQLRFVKIAGAYEGQWIVSDGLQTGDKVVVLGVNKVKPEQAVEVRILPSATPAPMNMPIMPEQTSRVGEHSVLAPNTQKTVPQQTSPSQNQATPSTSSTSNVEKEMMDAADDSQ